LPAFGAALKGLAEDAARKEIKLCLEHVPGRALGSARETLDFLKQLSHPNLFLLLDVGHTLLSRENPWEVIEEAGTRIGYVHMSDNDGKKDRHWPLLDGRLTYESLAKTIRALNQVGYQGTIGLELYKDFASLISGLSKSRNLLIRVQFSDEPKSLREPETRRKQ
jgi:sugar phosphate isomerase/epimerase